MNAFRFFQQAIQNGSLVLPTSPAQTEVKAPVVLGSNDEADYYDILRVSNSDLRNAYYMLNNVYQVPKSEKILTFGKAIHTAILEPGYFTLANFPDTLDVDLLFKLRDIVRADEYCRDLLTGTIEKPVLWQEPTTGTLCKCKPDVAYQSMIVDLKTTCATTQHGFETSMVRFGYHVQMAFYGDSVGAKEMVIIGVSKKNGKIFIYHTHTDSDFIQSGRNQYHHLLSEIKRLNLYQKVFAARG